MPQNLSPAANLAAKLDEWNSAMVEESLARSPAGMAPYYQRRAEMGAILSITDRWLISYLWHNYRSSRSTRDSAPEGRMFEIAAGGAQISHCLSLLHYQAHAIEIDPDRYDYAEILARVVGAATRLFCHDWSALPWSRLGPTVVFATNAVSSRIDRSGEQTRLAFNQILDAGGAIILIPRLWGVEDSPIPVDIPNAEILSLPHGYVQWRRML